MLYVYQSNRLEVLADRLVRTIDAHPLPPLAGEQIVVGSAQCGRWLALRIADLTGICANTRFVLPARFLWDQFRAVLGDLPHTGSFEPQVLAWRIFALLPALAPRPGFDELRRYLDGADERMRMDLARRLAQVFDQYLIFRPDWIAAWEGGAGAEDWQAQLWRCLVSQAQAPHWLRARDACFARLAAEPGARDLLPARVSVLGVSSLSPAYLDAIARLADHIDVHFHLLNPCRAWWAEIRSGRELARRGAVDEEAAYYEVGHPLLAAFGRQGRELCAAFVEMQAREHDAFVEPGEDSLLHRLQSDILDLHDRGGAATPVDPDDRSIAVHACHGPLREVEVLHDRLLEMFQRDAGLQPGEVCVLLPDVDLYAAHVEAVFGAAAGVRHIPWVLGGHERRGDAAYADAFLAVLDAAAGRMPADEVLDLLNQAPIRRRFGIGGGDLDRILHWMNAAGIRWGRDRQHRVDLGLPDEPANTWRAGLDRLLLGYALPGDGTRLFAGVLPCADVEGDGADLLGRFADLIAALARIPELLSRPRPVAAWCDALLGLAGSVLEAGDEDAAAESMLRAALAAIREEAQLADCVQPVAFEPVRDALDRGLRAQARALGVPAGAVSFGPLGAQRVLPARVVCVLGMNDGTLPRRAPQYGFDRIRSDPRRGDRLAQDEDRFAVLEAILAAREVLYMSWVGRDARENADRMPSVLLAEILDCIDRGFAPIGGRPAGRGRIVYHPLQPFSRRCFEADAAVASYAAEYCPPPRLMPEPPFATTPPAQRAAPVVFTVGELWNVLRNPARAFLERRIGVRLATAGEVPEGVEPFALDALQGWRLDQRLLALRRGGAEPGADAYALLAAEGLLPHGTPGLLAHAEHARRIESLMQRLGDDAGAVALAAAVDIELGSVRVQGALPDLTDRGIIGCSTGRLKARDRLGLWLRHLLLCAGQPRGALPASRHVAGDREVRFGPLPAAQAHERLRELAALAAQALARPVPLFMQSSSEYAAAIARGDPEPLADARRWWAETLAGRGAPGADAADAHVRYLYRESIPLDAWFERLALEVWSPLLAAAIEDRK
ncbi:MAG: exodeoxyribonuclease V subunit gamma [Gammaproteobacteria bacterium]